MAEIHSANQEIGNEESTSKHYEYPHHVFVIKNIEDSFTSLRPPLDPDCSIYKVRNQLRILNQAAYTPQIVSIGPLHHHGNITLKKMEDHKLRYLGNFLKHVAESASLEDFVNKIQQWESRIRRCYAETFDHLSSDEFVKMVLVDAGFIFELFLGKYFVSTYTNSGSNEWVLEYVQEFKRQPWLLSEIERDLRLLENQLPFFVLEGLYNMAFSSSPSNFPDFRELTRDYFSGYNIQEKFIEQEVKHFTDLLRSFWLPPSSEPETPGSEPEIHDVIIPNDESIQRKVKCSIDLLLRCSRIHAKPKDVNDRITCLYSASELHDAGVKFEESQSKCLLDIKFSDGVLTFPCLILLDDTESYIRNLMALEQCLYPIQTHICDYVATMDHLINTAKDVDLLVQKKIIVNMLGDRERVATLFNNLCTHIVLAENSWYIPICKDLNAFYNVPRHKWKAILYEEYFSTPWRIASLQLYCLCLL